MNQTCRLSPRLGKTRTNKFMSKKSDIGTMLDTLAHLGRRERRVQTSSTEDVHLN